MKIREPNAEGGSRASASPWPRERRVRRWVRPALALLHYEPAGGIVLLACALVALFFANSPWADAYHALWDTHLRIGIGSFQLDHPLEVWINDGLMTVFFFAVGLEIKREVVRGELRDPRNSALPVVAAVGGMVVPAILYLVVLGGQPGRAGWGVPVATDIAFLVGTLALLGRRVPTGLKVLLLTLAVVDDIGAVLVIAVVYTEAVQLLALTLGLAGLVLMVVMNWAEVRTVWLYVAVGILIWVVFLQSRVHPTIAGVLIGLLTPTKSLLAEPTLFRVLEEWLRRHHGPAKASVPCRREALAELASAATEAVPPLDRLEAALHPWVAFAIMPLFALVNAGVHVDVAGIRDPVALAVVAGLVLGKPLGIALFSFLALKTRLARLPTGTGWKALLAGGCLAGIGFTMSLFISGLAFHGPQNAQHHAAAKIGILLGSAVSAGLGAIVFIAVLPPNSDKR